MAGQPRCDSGLVATRQRLNGPAERQEENWGSSQTSWSVRERIVTVLDAKYKRLQDSPRRPRGIEPADLYQIVAYALLWLLASAYCLA
jgi:5-methylcytosine-specific restriction endonuclease McrBC regulatory subunit McrC